MSLAREPGDYGTLMTMPYPLRALRRINAMDLAAIIQLNRLGRWVNLSRFFRLVSRLGDGWFWYALILALPALYGHAGAVVSLHIGLTALINIALYKYLKTRLIRPRPFNKRREIECGAPIMDQYSFPSGHTLHAVCFTTMMFPYYPESIWILLPFTVLVAFSRMILGLHYPTDVLAGGTIGFVMARLSLYAFGHCTLTGC